MKITLAEFVKSAFERSHWVDDGMPEIAFLGRSNVGKSSLLNSLLGRKGLARTSNTPGRTQSINYFLINGHFYFVDLPGYGYARAPKTMRADWGKMAEEYLSNRKELVLAVHLVDSRHPPSQLDLLLHSWLVFHNTPHIIVATKSDKPSKRDLNKNLKIIEEKMPGSTVLTYSSRTGTGRDRLWEQIAEFI